MALKSLDWKHLASESEAPLLVFKNAAASSNWSVWKHDVVHREMFIPDLFIPA